jgi:hypothetical protein
MSNRFEVLFVEDEAGGMELTIRALRSVNITGRI